MNAVARAMVIVGAALAAGCVSVLPDAPPPAARYLLDAATFDASSETAYAEWSLAVDDPQSTRVYDNTKIAVLRAPGRIEYFAGGEWADRSQRLFQAALIRSFENSGRVLGVGDRTGLPVSDFILQTDIRAIHADYTGGSPVAVFDVFARLTNGRGRVFAARRFRETVEAQDDDVAALAGAFDAAVSAALEKMVDWSLVESDAAYAK